jgi:uncharacterized Zn finger protein
MGKDKSAGRTFSKQLINCPNCGNNEPKEFVEVVKKEGLIFKTSKSEFVVHCHQCNSVVPQKPTLTDSFLSGFRSGKKLTGK